MGPMLPLIPLLNENFRLYSGHLYCIQTQRQVNTLPLTPHVQQLTLLRWRRRRTICACIIVILLWNSPDKTQNIVMSIADCCPGRCDVVRYSTTTPQFASPISKIPEQVLTFVSNNRQQQMTVNFTT